MSLNVTKSRNQSRNEACIKLLRGNTTQYIRVYRVDVANVIILFLINYSPSRCWLTMVFVDTFWAANAENNPIRLFACTILAPKNATKNPDEL